MADKINHGRSKMISSYGGVGSLIDTQDASIIIETFDNWGYPYSFDNDIKQYIIEDDRLLTRLRSLFPNLNYLVSIPVEEDDWRKSVVPEANYFPKWFYCPICKRFMDFKEWEKKWVNRNYEFNLQCFNPKCNGTHLEQVRFVMTCDNGHIHDLPWSFWNNRKDFEEQPNEQVDEDDKSTVKLIYEKCCPEQELYYITSNENTDLSGIHIKCKKCNKSATLKGVFGFSQKCGRIKYWEGFNKGKRISDIECDKRSVVKIKTSNSIYYSNTLSSLWIPEKSIKNLTLEVKAQIETIVNHKRYLPSDLDDYASEKNIPIEVINNYLKRDYIPEDNFRESEYDYFLKGEATDNEMIKFRRIEVKNRIFGFDKLVKIDRLKKITVQTSFTRNEPIDIDSILIDDNNYEYEVKRQSVSKNSFKTQILPAIENYGEGILFVMDLEKLKLWEKNDMTKDRIEIMKIHAGASDWKFHKNEASKLSPRKALIHTLSHLLIREFEYYAGYPMSSLQERLFVNDRMCGFLISAYDGSDGYLGGLTKLCNNIDKLQEILQNALNRAKDCSLDPICYESEGQGVSQLNLAACHSCTLIPDTSCEMSNLFLDRRLLIDDEFGFFNQFLKE